MRRVRVAVLGGGCGGVAAAWGLSRTPELRRRFEVTLVQPGWRLGGKGTTGRHPRHGGRIEEHGLHVWMGFYRNAFGIVDDVYRAWGRPIEEAFTPHHTVSLLDRDGLAMHLRLPPRPGLPWDDAPHRRVFVRELARWMVRELPRSIGEVSGRQVRDNVRLVTTVLRGLRRDGVAALDEHDLCAWLRQHGPDDPAVYDAPAVRAFYNLAFAYPDGEPGFGKGALAAGPALSAMMRMLLTYRGAPFWKMNAGMGDTIFAPAYEVLRDRGVRMALFHRVERLRVRGTRVSAIELAVQAEEEQAGSYDALQALGTQRVWPHRPRTDGLRRMAAGDLEAASGPSLGTVTWRQGEDFDAVVLAVPAPAHRRIAAELMAASPRYRLMVEHSASVATIAAQLWFRSSLEGLGWRGPSTVSTNGRGLFSSWADMTDTVDAEDWAERPGLAAYFCDVAPDRWFEGMDRAAACEAIRDRGQRWFADELPEVLPGACEAELVHGPIEPGETPLRAQYFRANIDDWERYVLTLPGTVKHRLAPDESGFDNLALAGDWTRTSINGGSVEAAAESGRQAADAVLARCG